MGLEILTDNLLAIIFMAVSIIVSFVFVFIIRKITKKTNKNKLLFEDFNIGKFNIVLFRKVGDRYHQIEKVKMDVSKDDGFRYNNKDFTTFSMKDIAYSDAKNNYYAFDYDSGEQLTFKTKGMPDKISIDDVDIYVNRNIIEQLVAGLEDLKPKGQWTMLIIGIVLGLAIGIIIGIYLAPTITGTSNIPPVPTSTPMPPTAFVQNMMEKLR